MNCTIWQVVTEKGREEERGKERETRGRESARERERESAREREREIESEMLPLELGNSVTGVPRARLKKRTDLD